MDSRNVCINFLFAIALCILYTCTGEEDQTVSSRVDEIFHDHPVSVSVGAPPFEKLSEYGFFTGRLADLQPNKGVLPFEPITPLFSDYAHKSRFVWMPDNVTATIEGTRPFDFPVGAVLIKNFFYPETPVGRRIMETRLLVKNPKKWDALAYVWNEQQTEAILELAGAVLESDWINTDGERVQAKYIVPNKNQCKSCHEKDKKLLPIGPHPSYLNSVFNYKEGRMNQLEKWKQVGYLSDVEGLKEYGEIAKWDDEEESLEARALAYLEVNCGTCHSRKGPAASSGLFLTTKIEDRNHLGICKNPVSAGSGSGGRTYDIVPGSPERSIVIYRMKSLNPAEMMPELGRKLVHQEGIELISDWISSLEGDCP